MFYKNCVLALFIIGLSINTNIFASAQCRLSDNQLNPSDVSKVINSCSTSGVNFCNTCICSLIDDISSKFTDTTTGCINDSDELSECEADYIFLLFRNGVLSLDLLEKIAICGSIDYTQCSSYPTWSSCNQTGTPPPMVDSPPPMVDSPPPVVDSPPPMVDSPPPIVDSPPPVVVSPPPMVDSPPPMVDSPPPVVDSPPPVVVSPPPVVDSPPIVSPPLPPESPNSSAGTKSINIFTTIIVSILAYVFLG